MARDCEAGHIDYSAEGLVAQVGRRFRCVPSKLGVRPALTREPRARPAAAELILKVSFPPYLVNLDLYGAVDENRSGSRARAHARDLSLALADTVA